MSSKNGYNKITMSQCTRVYIHRYIRTLFNNISMSIFDCIIYIYTVLYNFYIFYIYNHIYKCIYIYIHYIILCIYIYSSFYLYISLHL